MAGNSGRFSNSQSFTHTQVQATINVPLSYIIVNSKWRSTELCNGLQGNSRILYEDDLGLVDFHPTSHMAVVYAAEVDIVSQVVVRRKLAKLRRANKFQVLVLAERTSASSQYYQDFQKIVCMELGFMITPVPSQIEAAGILAQIVQNENRQESNPFTKKKRNENLDQAMLLTLQSVPKLGNVKAKLLLEHFCSLQAIGAASLDDLAKIVGKASAQTIKSFLEMNNT